MKAPAHHCGAGSRASEGAAARRGSPSSSPHWTQAFLGLAYDPAGEGPQAFNCWSFFRHVQRQRFAREIPPVPLPASLMGALKLFRDRSDSFGWRRIERPEPPHDGDAALMSHRDRPHHIGVYVASVPGGAVLHCHEGPGVVLHSLFHLEIAAWNITGLYRPIEGRA